MLFCGLSSVECEEDAGIRLQKKNARQGTRVVGSAARVWDVEVATCGEQASCHKHTDTQTHRNTQTHRHRPHRHRPHRHRPQRHRPQRHTLLDFSCPVSEATNGTQKTLTVIGTIAVMFVSEWGNGASSTSRDPQSK